jgi:hypothetical protein
VRDGRWQRVALGEIASSDPASRHTSTKRVAPATSLAPQALKNSVPPPNVPVPKQSTGTLNPDRPGCRDSIMSLV